MKPLPAMKRDWNTSLEMMVDRQLRRAQPLTAAQKPRQPEPTDRSRQPELADRSRTQQVPQLRQRRSRLTPAAADSATCTR
jgi:hypothetical protein